MSGPNMILFALPDELADLINRLVLANGFAATLIPWPARGEISGRTHDGPLTGELLRANQVWLHAASQRYEPPADDISPVREGWIRVLSRGLYVRDDHTELAASNVDARSDYLENGHIKRNPEIVQIFRTISRPLKKALHHPMVMRDKQSGKQTLVRDMYYSDGAADLVTKGGQLVLIGQPRPVFLPPDAVSANSVLNT